MVEYMECPRAFLGKLVPEHFFFSVKDRPDLHSAMRHASLSQGPCAVCGQGSPSELEVHVPGQPPLVLWAADHYFYCPRALAGAVDEAQWAAVPAAHRHAVRTVLDMYVDNYLRPGVLVLCGEDAPRRACLQAIRGLLKHRLAATLHERTVSVLCEKDKVCGAGAGTGPGAWGVGVCGASAVLCRGHWAPTGHGVQFDQTTDRGSVVQPIPHRMPSAGTRMD